MSWGKSTLFLAAATFTCLGAESSGDNCSFRNAPDDFLNAQRRAIESTNSRIRQFQPKSALGIRSARAVPPSSLRWVNFIDQEILGKAEKAQVQVAPLSTDAEFVRRIYLDLIGRAPKVAEARAFLADPNENKRDEIIDRLLNSPDFTYRWANWFGELVQNNRTSINVNLQNEGRNAFYEYFRMAINENRPIKDLAYEMIANSGNNYDSGQNNFMVKTVTPGGPVQDRYDTAFSRAASMFLGMGHYDCLLCHDGRGHLEQLSAWGKRTTRMEAYKMAAFFSRANLTGRGNIPGGSPYSNSFDVSDRTTGTYDLNTNYGNRPNRIKVGTLVNLTPEYRDGKVTSNSVNWREAFAAQLVVDPMFARNMSNRIWKQLFTMGLVEPVDQMDPARLDPKNPPADPWTLQATHPELLEQLAAFMVNSNYGLRESIRLMVSSTAYQLSSRYDDEWKLEYVPLFARHFARRLEGEEIHDTLMDASGLIQEYPIGGYGTDTVRYAWRMPDATEPQGNQGNARVFMDYFLRGNRDTQLRTQQVSIQQRLALMNDGFIYNRTRVATAPNLATILKITDNGKMLEELYLAYLARVPSDVEKTKAMAFLSKATTAALRSAALEDLAWALVQKTDFLFNY